MSEGWHPDPLGRYAQRYHDGSAWTAHVSNVAGVTEEDPLGTALSAPGMPVAPPVGHYDPYRAGPAKGNAVLRFIAVMIDGLVLSIPLYLIFGTQFDDILLYDTDSAGQIIVDSIEWNIPMGLVVTQLLVTAAYQIFMVGSLGRTLGKMVLGLTVVRASDAGPVGFGLATVRYVAWFMYVIPLVGIVLFIISAVRGFSDSRGQTLHDSVAKTMVAKTSTLSAS